MFCNQCEQTKRGGDEVGCFVEGNCGKTESSASLQDLIIFASRGIATYALLAREVGVDTSRAEAFLPPLLFTTLNMTASRPFTLMICLFFSKPSVICAVSLSRTT